MKNKSGKLIRQGDVYWVNFDPSVGSEIRKKRPALVIQDHNIAEKSNTILVCPLTSSKNIHPFDVAINEAFLEKNSRVRTIQVTTCDISRFSEFYGRISASSMKKILERILILLGF